jgi:hypothetical protein
MFLLCSWMECRRLAIQTSLRPKVLRRRARQLRILTDLADIGMELVEHVRQQVLEGMLLPVPIRWRLLCVWLGRFGRLSLWKPGWQRMGLQTFSRFGGVRPSSRQSGGHGTAVEDQGAEVGGGGGCFRCGARRRRSQSEACRAAFRCAGGGCAGEGGFPRSG